MTDQKPISKEDALYFAMVNLINEHEAAANDATGAALRLMVTIGTAIGSGEASADFNFQPDEKGWQRPTVRAVFQMFDAPVEEQKDEASL